MQTTGKKAALVILAAGLIVTVTMVTLGLSADRGDGAAHGQGPVTLAIDMDPYGVPANSCPGDGVTDCTVGSIQR